jgi:hypothetical protein
MRTSKIPKGAEVVRTYAQYEEHVGAFFAGRYHLFMVVGAPGLVKSHSFEKRLGATSHLIRGWTAPLQAYIDTYRHRNKLLIFDDAEVLWKRPGGRVLLRSLCELKPQKLMQWASTAQGLVKAGVPQSFLTSSKVAVVANRFVFGDAEEHEAVLDRGHVIHFDPSPNEVHAQVGDWFWCQEVYDYIGERLHLLSNVSARLYIKAWERRQAGGDWRRLLDEAYCREGAMRFVQLLEVDPSCKTVDDRAKKFTDYTGACRATYFNLKRELKQADQLHAFQKVETPKRELHSQPPAEPSLEDEVARAKEEDQRPSRGQLGTNQNSPRSDDADGPSWCQYSDDPTDYNTYADYLDDWWKRPVTPREDGLVTPEPAAPEHFGTDDIAPLRRELSEAIKREDYERAAELRDEIQCRGGQSNTDV